MENYSLQLKSGQNLLFSGLIEKDRIINPDSIDFDLEVLQIGL